MIPDLSDIGPDGNVRHEQFMKDPPDPRQFATTRWSMVLAVRGDGSGEDSLESRAAIFSKFGVATEDHRGVRRNKY